MKARHGSQAWWERVILTPSPQDYLASAPRQELKKYFEPVMSSRASLLDLHGTCDRFSEDIFTASPVDGRDFHAAERKLVDCLPSTWRLIELSPIAPLGSNTQLTGLSQFTIAHAARDAEVLPDAVIPLSVYATSLARNLDDIVTMAASHRELRMQPHTTPGFSKHFRAFSIASVSRESAHHSRKRGALRDQVSYWFTVLATLAPGVPVRIEFSYAPVAKALMETLGGTRRTLRLTHELASRVRLKTDTQRCS